MRLSKERWDSKLERWRKIALESCKQCGRDLAPEIRALVPFKDLVAGFGSFDEILIPTLAVPGEDLGRTLKGSKAKKVLVVVGPEGDFTEKEVEEAVRHGAKPVSLGPLVMRSETAAIYLLSSLTFFYREIAK